MQINQAPCASQSSPAASTCCVASTIETSFVVEAHLVRRKQVFSGGGRYSHCEQGAPWSTRLDSRKHFKRTFDGLNCGHGGGKTSY